MGVFTHGPRICLEFELLDRSLRDLTQQTEHHILPLMQIKIILQQVWLETSKTLTILFENILLLCKQNALFSKK